MVDLVQKDMLTLWADTGDILQPDDTKISNGWDVELVPRQWWNWMQNRVDTNVAYLLQKGIPEWNSTVEYIINKSYVQYLGVVYKCIQTHTNQAPAIGAYWVKAFAESSASLEAIHAITPAANTFPYFTGTTSAATTAITAFARGLLDDADAATARATLGAQQADATLTALAGLTTATNKLPYFTGTDAAAVTDLTAFARSLLDDSDAATARATLGAQQADATLTALAGLTTATNKLPYFTSADTSAVTDFTAFARNLLDDADAAAARVTLGLASGATTTVGTIATQNANSVTITGGSITGITDLAVTDGGTGASTAAGARTNLGLGSAATATLQTSTTDTTTGSVLVNGAFGLGTIGTVVSNLNTISVSGFYKASPGAIGQPETTLLGHNIYYQGDDQFGTMTAWGFDGAKVFQRRKTSGTWYSWREFVGSDGVDFTGADLNNLSDAGFFYASNASPVNYPGGFNSGLVIVTTSPANVRTQVFFPIGAKEKMYFRTFFTTWGAWQEVFTSSNQLALGTTAVSGRTALGLGTASTAAVTTSATDTTAGRLLKVGDFGLGGTGVLAPTDLNTITATGLYYTNTSDASSPSPGAAMTIQHIAIGSTNATQVAIRQSADFMWFRRRNSGTWSDWVQVATSAIGLGQGQTWQNVTASRAQGTTYTNTTGKPIFVSIFGSCNSGSKPLTVNGLAVATHTPIGTGSISTTITAIVPDGGTYSLANVGGTTLWMELR